MFKFRLALALCCISSISLLAQKNAKVNFPLVQKILTHSSEEVTAMVKGESNKIKELAKTLDVEYLYSIKDISVVRGKAANLSVLAEASFVKRIEMNNNHFHVLDDSSLSKTNTLPVHSGQAPLAQAYKGKNVIIGVIDTGIDFGHPDFKDSLGNTRVLWIWDQGHTGASITPQPYNYGQEWDSAQINSGACTHTDYTNGGHGTKVSGAAAGNGNTAFKYRGMAPEADIIFVSIDFNSTNATVVDGANYIFDKATQLGKPCVINISIGDYYGSHDGTDLQAQALDNMLSTQSGRAIVAANGNGGNIPFHLGNTVGTDTNFTWIRNGDPQVFIDIYADTADFKNVDFTIGATDDTTFSYRGNIGFRNMDSSLFVVKTDTLWNNSNRLGIVYTYTDIVDSLVIFSVMIEPDSLNYLWSFESKGSGYFDSWNFDFVQSGLPATTLRPDMIYYRRPDTLQTVCTSFQCSDKVISVGNYVCREGYVDVDSIYQVFPGTVDSIFNSSSHGPTRDGRIKPDISAPGENIVTVGERNFMTWLIANYPFIVTEDSMHMIFGGTSAASPVVTGLAALYFEMNPTANYSQLKQDMINCSIQDSFTGVVANNTYGYGKLDGYGALTCQNPIGIKDLDTHKNDLKVYPNPNGGNMYLEFNFSGNSVLSVFDVCGKLIHSELISSNKHQLQLSTVTQGVYFIRVENGNQSVNQKVVIQ